MLNAYLNIFSIFALMFVGYFFSFKRWFTSDTADTFSKIVLNLGLPFGMFLTITKNFTRSEFLRLFHGMLVPALSMLLALFISIFYARISHMKKNRRGSFSVMIMCSNTIFIGLPINLAIFGEKAMPYVLLYYLVNTSFFWTIGVYRLAQDSPFYARETARFSPLVALKKILNPAMSGFLVGLLCVFLRFSPPAFLASFAGSLGALTTPLSCMFLGIQIYFLGVKNVKIERDSLLVFAGRFLLSPFLVFLLCRIISLPPLMEQVFLIQSAMPVQNSVPMLAKLYQGDEKFATSTMGISVLVFVLIVPLYLLFLFS